MDSRYFVHSSVPLYSSQYPEDDMMTPFDPSLIGIQHPDLHDFQTKRMTEESVISSEHVLLAYGQPPPPPLHIPFDNPAMFNDRQVWSSTGDGYRDSIRYMSPSGHFGGTLSEASSASDIAHSPETTTAYTHPYPNSPIAVHTSYTYGSMDVPMVGHMPWQPDSQTSYPPTSSFLYENMSLYSMKELEFSAPEELQMEDSLYGETLEVKKPHMFEPEELELSGASSVTENSLRLSTPSFKFQAENDEDEDSMREDESIPADNDSDSDYQARRKRTVRGKPTISQSARNLRPSHRVSQPILSSASKVRKPAQGHNRGSSKRKLPSINSVNRNSATVKMDRYFPCTFHAFGCDATFGNKNEWKRHVASQHLRLGYYRCSLGDCDPDTGAYAGNGRRQSNKDVKIYNDFNRKDLFTQHCRRMHGPARQSVNNKATKEEELAFEGKLDGIRQRCWRVRRKAPARSSCGFCSRVFEASGEEGSEERAWEERMEHVGRHHEKDNIDIKDEAVDDDLVEWGLQTGVFSAVSGYGPWLVDYPLTEDTGRQPGIKSDFTRRGRRHSARSVAQHNWQNEQDSEDDAYAEDE